MQHLSLREQLDGYWKAPNGDAFQFTVVEESNSDTVEVIRANKLAVTQRFTVFTINNKDYLRIIHNSGQVSEFQIKITGDTLKLKQGQTVLFMTKTG